MATGQDQRVLRQLGTLLAVGTAGELTDGQLLGWPVGTVKSRLTRARERLRDRLTRRGFTPSAGVITLLRPGVMEDLLPGALVQATTSAAVRFGASRVLLSGSAAILAQGVLTAMSMTRWWKVASLLLVAGATVSSTGLLADKGTMAVAAPSQDVSKATAAGPGADMPVAEVKPGKFKLAVVEHGTLEPSRRNDVVAQAEGRTTIKLNLLRNYTKGKTIKELKTEVKKARSDELAKKLRWDLEKEKVVKLERQIELCKIYAPAEGVIQHVNDPNWTPFIQGGAPVRERQLLFHILEPGSPLLVNAKIPEAKIDRVRPGQKARIQVDAFPGAELIGTVKDVFPLPDPTSFFSSNTKVYTTHLTIDNPLPGLRPGMTAKVIQIVERDDALTVPVSAVLRGVGKNHVAVQRSDGGFEWREVVLGDTSGEVVEVKQGLKPGEQVALKPLELVREGVNRDKTLEPTKPR